MSAANLYTNGQMPAVRGVQITHATEGLNGACPFFKDGLCMLHDKGLKPTEGRLASHGTAETITQELYESAREGNLDDLGEMLLLPNSLVTMSWLSESNQDDVKFLLKEFS